MREKLQRLPAGLNTPRALLADTGYLSEANLNACIQPESEPPMAPGREGHYPHWEERFSEPAPLPEEATPVEKTKHPPQEAGEQEALRAAPADGGAGLRHHHLRSVPHPRTGQRPGGMDAGVPGVALEAHGRMTPAAGKKPENVTFVAENRRFLAASAPGTAPPRSTSDRLLGKR